MLGSGAIVVMDETTDMVKACWRIVRFFARESCGKCTPCREGTTWLERILRRILDGYGRPSDLDLLLRRVRQHQSRPRLAAQADHHLPPRPVGHGAASRRRSRCSADEFEAYIGTAGRRSASRRPPMSDQAEAPKKTTVTVTIDGVDIDGRSPASWLIAAAERHGIYIPRFCYHPRMEPVGMCRMCLVDVDTGRGPALAVSCMIERVRGHEGRHRGPPGQEGPGRRARVPPHQPPARLPGLRQGRRVPAAGPDAEPTARARAGSSRRSGTTRSRSRSATSSTSTVSAASSATAAPGSPRRSPATR